MLTASSFARSSTFVDWPAGAVPLQVTAHLASGIASGVEWGPALDGLLAARLWSARKNERPADAPRGLDPEHDPEDMPVPLARVHYEDGWYWAATCGWPVDLDPTPEVRYWAGRADQRHLAELCETMPKEISESTGRWRSRVMPTPVLMCSRMRWHAVGDPDAVEELLAPVRAIGKRRGTGEGEVLRWDIAELAAGALEAAHLDQWGRLARPTPVSVMGEEPSVPCGPVSIYGIRPPALHPSRRELVRLPCSTEAEVDLEQCR